MKKLFLFLAICCLSAALHAQTCVTGTFQTQTQNWGQEISWSILDVFGNAVYQSPAFTSYSQYIDTVCLPQGCYVLVMEDSFGDGWNNANLTFSTSGGTTSAYTLPSGNYLVVPISFDNDSLCGPVNEIYGCTDPNALNYNPAATIDSGNCQYPQDIYGCMDPNASNYNPWATIDNGTCQYPIQCDSGVVADLYICVFSLGANVGFELLDDAGNIIYSQFGFPDFAIEHIDVCIQDGVCYTANMYNTAGPYGWYNGYFWVNGPGGNQFVTDELYTGEAYDFISFSSNGGCTGSAVAGCMDPSALNYNPSATIDDGSCVYVTDSCEANVISAVVCGGLWSEEMSFNISDENGVSYLYGNSFSDGSCTTLLSCLSDGCYTLEMYDSFGDGWNGGSMSIYVNGVGVLLNVSMSSGSYISYPFAVNSSDCDSVSQVYGCTDPNALNYNPLATINDGSCSYQNDSLCLAYWELLDIDEEGDVVYLWNGSYGENLTYLWDFGDGTTSTEELPTHQYLEDGTYLVCLTIASGQNGAISCTGMFCDSIAYYNPPVIGGAGSTGGFWLNVSGSQVLGLHDMLSLDQLNIYPNPSNDIMNLNFMMTQQEHLIISIYDLSGKLMHAKQSNMFAGQQNIAVDVSTLAEGSYLLEIQGNSLRTIRNFTVIR